MPPSPERLEKALLNITYTENGACIKHLSRKLHTSLDQTRTLVLQLIEREYLFETHTITRTVYHCDTHTVQPLLEDKALQLKLQHDLRRHPAGETAVKLAQRYNCPTETIEANLTRAVMKGEILRKRVGKLQIYRVP